MWITLILKIKYRYVFDLHRSVRSLLFRSILGGEQNFVLNKHYIKRFLLTNLGINQYTRPLSIVDRYFAAANMLNVLPKGRSEIWIETNELKRIYNYLSSIIDIDISDEADSICNIIRIEKGMIPRKWQRIISMMPFAKWRTKEWGDNKFIELGRKLAEEKGVKILVLGGEQERSRSKEIAAEIGMEAIPLAGRLTLFETATALSISDILVTNDTGVMHMGGAVSIPVVAIFGSTTEELGFFPYKTDGEVVQLDLNCRPCSKIGLIRCPKKHFKCMNDITVEMVYSSMLKYLQYFSAPEI